jgi:hypothetical protein
MRVGQDLKRPDLDDLGLELSAGAHAAHDFPTARAGRYQVVIGV